MLVFNGVNPYHIPKYVFDLFWYALLFLWFAWLTRGLVKSFYESYRLRKVIRQKDWEKTLRTVEKIWEEQKKREKEEQQLAEITGFRSPVIIRLKSVKKVPKKGTTET